MYYYRVRKKKYYTPIFEKFSDVLAIPLKEVEEEVLSFVFVF